MEHIILKDNCFGNRCGHSPLFFRSFQPPTEHKERPWILRKVIDALKLLPDKGQLKLFDTFIKKLSLFNLTRKKRSERLEGISLMLQVILHYMDLSSLRVGVPNSFSFYNLTLEFMAEKAGLPLRRAKRAMADLVKVGYIKVKRQTKKLADGQYLNLAAIRQVSKGLLADLGVNLDRLKQERHKLLGRKKKKALDDRYFELTNGKNIKTAADHLNLIKEIINQSPRIKKPP